jgi:RNA recognition motif-containing protein
LLSFPQKGWTESPEPTVEEVETFYGKYGKVCSVRLRRRRDKTFKGTMLVEFSSAAEAEKTLKEHPQVDEKDVIYLAAYICSFIFYFYFFYNHFYFFSADWQKEKEEEMKNRREQRKQETKNDKEEKEDKKENKDENETEAKEESVAGKKRERSEVEHEIEHGRVLKFTGAPEAVKRTELKVIII